MEALGLEYLYTLSILCINFAALSVLVTVIRQIKGGPLSAVDLYLVRTFTSAGFAQCIAAALPPVTYLFGLTSQALWAVSSGTAALLFAAVIAHIQCEHRKVGAGRLGSFLIVAFAGLWVSVLLLIVNALVPSVHGIGLHAAAVTLSLGTAMWSFVRRVAFLGSHDAGGDQYLRNGS